MKSISLFFVGVCLFALNVKADTAGCLISTGAGPKVYYQPEFAGTTTFFQGSGTVRYGDVGSCQAGNSPTNSYYVLTSSSAVACHAGYGSGSNTDPANYSLHGTKVTFNVANCPIDDYVPFGLLIIGMIGFFRLSSRSIKEF